MSSVPITYLDLLLGVVQRCDLPLTFKERTAANGSCYYLCLKDQISRLDISQENHETFGKLDAKARQMYLGNLDARELYEAGDQNHEPGPKFKFLTAWSLRNLVCDLVQFWNENDFCGKQEFLITHSEAAKKSIEELLAHQRSDLAWAEDIFIDASVEMLKVPIWMFTEHSTKAFPYPIEKGQFFRNKTAMILGSWRNQHFQSFWPKTLFSLRSATHQASPSSSQAFARNMTSAENQSSTSGSHEIAMNMTPSENQPSAPSIQEVTMTPSEAKSLPSRSQDVVMAMTSADNQPSPSGSQSMTPAEDQSSPLSNQDVVMTMTPTDNQPLSSRSQEVVVNEKIGTKIENMMVCTYYFYCKCE